MNGIQHIRMLLLLAGCLAVSTSHAQDSLLTLDRAIELALNNNFDIRIARNTSEQAANNNTPGNAGMLPDIDLNGAYQKTIGSAEQHLSSGEVVDRSNSVSDNAIANVALNWTVFDGMAMFATRRKLEELSAQGEQSLRIQIENTTAAVINAYYAIVGQEQLLRVVREQIVANTEIEGIAARKLANGSGARLELLLARTELNAQRSAELTAQAGSDKAKVELRRLLALEPRTDYSVVDTVIIIYDPSLDQLKEDAERQNSLLLLYDREQRIAELGLKEYNALRLPIVDVNGAYQFSRSTNNASFLLLNQNLGYTFGITATMPLFHGFTVNTAVKNAKLDLLNAQLAYTRQEQTLAADVIKAYELFQGAKGVLQLEEENIAAAREMLLIAQERFRAGVSTMVELRIAQSTHAAAILRLVNARYNAKFAETELRRLAGLLVR
ncbi:MAG: TolC family protein [Flavobacteriales bacterium]